MKKNMLLLLCMFVVLAFTAINCDDGEMLNGDYPIDVPFTEYSFAEACRWHGYSQAGFFYDLIVINSSEEFEAFVENLGRSGFDSDGSPRDNSDFREFEPPIDFSRYMLIMAYGVRGSGPVTPNYIRLQQYSESNYIMTVNILVGIASVYTYWQAPILVDKIVDGGIVELVVTNNF